MRKVTLGLFCIITGFTNTALAHAPYLNCKLQENHMIYCKGGFSDGSSAKRITLDVINDQEKILIHSKLDDKSEIRFKKPDEPFYILMDVGAGHTAIIEGESLK